MNIPDQTRQLSQLIERQSQVLGQQATQIMALEMAVSSLQAENAALRDKVAAAPAPDTAEAAPE